MLPCACILKTLLLMNESICITHNYNLVASHSADKLLCINAIMTSIVASNSQPLWLAQVCDGQAACPNVSTPSLICCFKCFFLPSYSSKH